MEKNRLPYYIKIDKNKDGIPVIHVRRFRFIFLMYLIPLFVFLGGMTLAIILLKLQSVALWVFGGLILLMGLVFPATIAMFVQFFQFFVNTNSIHLEADGILKRIHPLTWENSLKIPADRIHSVMSTQTHDSNNQPTKSLVVNLESGGMISLADNLTDSEVSNYLCDFIRNYYGLDEKPKNQSDDQ